MRLLATALIVCTLYLGTEALFGDCKKKEEACDTNSHCCGNLHCYYSDGYDPFEDGECVQCIDRSLVCQKDVQCCGSNLLCQKNTPVSVNGVCDILKPKGGRCYKDSQCASDDCEKARFWHLYGKCT